MLLWILFEFFFQRSLDSVSSAHNNMFLSLCQYMQGATHILDTYMADRDACGRGRDGRLGNIRKEHDTQNQTMEANLDLVLDRLRQSGLDEVGMAILDSYFILLPFFL